MYERSAIVLERYFENLLGYRREGNIRDNFNNYCELVEKLEKYQINYEKELTATEEFEDSLKKIRLIQASQKKLYEKSVKLEYNRNLMFNNIESKIEETRKCIEKIELDVEKNNKEMVEVKEKLISALTVYNEKRFELSKCKRYKKMAEKAYNDAYEIAVSNYDSITQDILDEAREFAKFEDAEDIIAELENNGRNEKIPFNEDVIRDATMFGIDIAKKEVAGYLIIYDKMTKLLSDIEEGATKIELHKKYARNEKAKMDFIYAVKDYMTQFLDYERMTIIHGRKSHNRLMSEACENFEADVIQINNLFELLIKEITNKSTKKAYKELYNKNYLIDIQEKDERFKREKNRVNLNTATLINSNYWRIEGIREIFTIFYKTVTEVLGRNVDEFDVINAEEYQGCENTDTEVQEEVAKPEIIEEKVSERPKKVKVEEVIEETEVLPFEIETVPEKKTKKVAVKQVKKKVSIEDDDETLFISNKDTRNVKNQEKLIEDEEEQEDDDFEEDDFDTADTDIFEDETESVEDIDDIDDVEDDEDYNSAEDMIDNLVQNFQSEDDEFDIFGEKYKNVDVLEKFNQKNKRASQSKENLEYSVEDEESLFTDIKKAKVNKKTKNEIQEMVIDERKPNTVIKKVKKIAKMKKPLAEEEF